MNKAERRILVEVQGATAAGIAKNSYVPRIATQEFDQRTSTDVQVISAQALKHINK